MTASSVRNAMTVDVEDYFHVAALANSIDRADWDNMPCRVENNTQRLLDLFAARGIHATFFVLGWVAQRYPALIRQIAAAGHEIASHGMSHKLVYDQSPREFADETRDAKALLEDITGGAIEGYRASTYSITKRSLWALDTLCELGFTYDSSIFPIRHDKYGIPDAQPQPHLLRAPGGLSIVEFPLGFARFAGARLPVSGGGYFRLLPYGLTRMGLRQINRDHQRPFAFYLHPWEVDPEQPRVKTSALSKFRHYTNLDECENRLKRLMADFRFAPMRDVLTDLALLPQTAAQPVAA
jgi:polysaccharide deacetylase family protein (PEP-CTERM system associated)